MASCTYRAWTGDEVALLGLIGVTKSPFFPQKVWIHSERQTTYVCENCATPSPVFEKNLWSPRMFLKKICDPLVEFELKQAVYQLVVNFQFIRDCQCGSAKSVQHNSHIFLSCFNLLQFHVQTKCKFKTIFNGSMNVA